MWCAILADLLIDSAGIDKEPDRAIPQLAGIQDQIRVIFGYFGAGLDQVNFVLKLALLPDDLDFITFFELGEIVEGVELTKATRPV